MWIEYAAVGWLVAVFAIMFFFYGGGESDE